MDPACWGEVAWRELGRVGFRDHGCHEWTRMAWCVEAKVGRAGWEVGNAVRGWGD
jgi:hypothetical protein